LKTVLGVLSFSGSTLRSAFFVIDAQHPVHAAKHLALFSVSHFHAPRRWIDVIDQDKVFTR